MTKENKHAKNSERILTIPAMLSKIHVFRPSLSESGAQAVVTMILNTDIITVKKAADDGNRAERTLTPIGYQAKHDLHDCSGLRTSADWL